MKSNDVRFIALCCTLFELLACKNSVEFSAEIGCKQRPNDTLSYNSDNLLGIRVNRTHFKYLGIMVGNNLKACFHQHWQNQIMKVKNLINSWKQRQLSIKGKIIIIKSLIIPKITLSLSLIPLDKQTCFTLKRLLFKFF